METSSCIFRLHGLRLSHAAAPRSSPVPAQRFRRVVPLPRVVPSARFGHCAGGSSWFFCFGLLHTNCCHCPSDPPLRVFLCAGARFRRGGTGAGKVDMRHVALRTRRPSAGGQEKRLPGSSPAVRTGQSWVIVGRAPAPTEGWPVSESSTGMGGCRAQDGWHCREAACDWAGTEGNQLAGRELGEQVVRISDCTGVAGLSCGGPVPTLPRPQLTPPSKGAAGTSTARRSTTPAGRRLATTKAESRAATHALLALRLELMV